MPPDLLSLSIPSIWSVKTSEEAYAPFEVRTEVDSSTIKGSSDEVKFDLVE